MSVTFFACEVSGTPIYPENFDATPKVDLDMPEYGPIAPENPWSVNLANSNAREVFAKLGMDLDDELMGNFDPAKLLRACDNALAVILRSQMCVVGKSAKKQLDTGTDSFEDRTPGKCKMVCCGHPAGYYTERFSALRNLAVQALKRNGVITYA